MGVIARKETVVLDLVHIYTPKPAFALRQEIPYKVNTAGTHSDIVRKL